MIESCPPPGKGQKHSHTIKSHHNVGGLPKDLKFTLIEPLRELFKVSRGSSLSFFAPCRSVCLSVAAKCILVEPLCKLFKVIHTVDLAQRGLLRDPNVADRR